MQKLLVICGPTATGKTDLALSLAHQFHGELISADSRQIYTGMDIGTGKDIPPHSPKESATLQVAGNLTKVIQYTIHSIPLWLYDIVSPKDSFNVHLYSQYAHACIEVCNDHKKLPILVGGTGLYIQSILEPLTVAVPPNERLRKLLSSQTTSVLQDRLKEMDPVTFEEMNNSDRNNNRRLIRKIEIATNGYKYSKKIETQTFNFHCVGLTASREYLQKVIERRIETRLKNGLIKEIQMLLNSGVTFEDQAFAAIGYREWKDYFDGKEKEESVIERWRQAEFDYAKRQMTFFSRMKSIKWFDVEKTDFKNLVKDSVQKWYNTP